MGTMVPDMPDIPDIPVAGPAGSRRHQEVVMDATKQIHRESNCRGAPAAESRNARRAEVQRAGHHTEHILPLANTHVGVSEMLALRALRDENQRLTHLVANLVLERQGSCEARGKK